MDNSSQAPQQPQATPPTSSTPPQVPLDPHGNPLPPLTRGQKIKYSLIAIIAVAVIGGLIAWTVTSSNKEDTRVNDIKANGIRVTGTATGEAYSYTDRSKRGGASTKFKVKYGYNTTDAKNLEAGEYESSAIGEKVYDTEAEVEALKGKTVDVYYDAKGGSVVENE